MKHEAIGHPKMHDLAAHIGQPLYAAHGIMEMLWHHAGDYSPDGDIGKLTDAAIARAVDWKDDPSVLIGALVESKFLDLDNGYRLLIHDWPDHAQEWVKKKLKRIQKKKAHEEIDWLQVYIRPAIPSSHSVQPFRPATLSVTDEIGNNCRPAIPSSHSVQSYPRAGGFSLAKGGKGKGISSSGTQHPNSENGSLQSGTENGIGNLGGFDARVLTEKLWEIHPSPSMFNDVEQALALEIKKSAPGMPPEVFANKITESLSSWAGYWLTEKRHAIGLAKWIESGDYARTPPIKKRAPQPDAPETSTQVLEREARQNEADEAARITRRATKTAAKETSA